MRRLSTVALLAGALVLTAASAAQAATPRTVNVASIGDSYAAGTGAGDYQAGTEGQCWRSANSASSDVVAKLRSRGARVNFADVACSGASISDLGQPYKGEPAQLDALTPHTDVVILTIGANDISFASYGGLCIVADCSGAPTDAELAQLPAVQADLTTLLSTIAAKSPHAQVVLAGYGRQLNPGPNPAGVQLDPICGDGVITPAERTDGNKVSFGLDTTLRSAGAAARESGVHVTFVSPYKADGTVVSAFDGHSLCESEAPYYRGLEALAPGQEGQDVVLHLNADGQAGIAQLIECAAASAFRH
jgi:lysophospholipase L1-like esterase